MTKMSIKLMPNLVIFLLALWHSASPLFAYELASVLDNQIIGTPKVVCEESEVALDILTAKPFIGNIFVKGRAKDHSCRQSFGEPDGHGKNSTSIYTLSLGKCGMQRLRSANPRGISFAVTVVVSFHPAGFITKNDRAYHLSCFYTEPEEVVTSSFEVSQLPSQELSDHMSMPSCRYSVHSGSLDGPQLSWANVGDTVYHVWECKGPELGILVKKCFVTDGDGEDHAVVDEDGCSLDLGLLSEIVYTEDDTMRAHAKSQVFKYADSNQLFFTCQIRMCQKQMDSCQGVTPPKCGKHDGHGHSGDHEKKKEKGKGKKDNKGKDGKFADDFDLEIEGADWSVDEAREEEAKQQINREEEFDKNGEGQKFKKNGGGEKFDKNGGGDKMMAKAEGVKMVVEMAERNNGTLETDGMEEVEWMMADGGRRRNKTIQADEKTNIPAEKEEEEDEDNDKDKEDKADFGKKPTADMLKGRGRRALLSQQHQMVSAAIKADDLEVDVASPQMLVLDREDQARIGKRQREAGFLLLKGFAATTTPGTTAAAAAASSSLNRGHAELDGGMLALRMDNEKEQQDEWEQFEAMPREDWGICLHQGQLLYAIPLTVALLVASVSMLTLCIGQLLAKQRRRQRRRGGGGGTPCNTIKWTSADGEFISAKV